MGDRRGGRSHARHGRSRAEPHRVRARKGSAPPISIERSSRESLRRECPCGGHPLPPCGSDRWRPIRLPLGRRAQARAARQRERDVALARSAAGSAPLFPSGTESHLIHRIFVRSRSGLHFSKAPAAGITETRGAAVTAIFRSSCSSRCGFRPYITGEVAAVRGLNEIAAGSPLRGGYAGRRDER
jgi:hypothetical protein